jgi:hypothetical protein
VSSGPRSRRNWTTCSPVPATSVAAASGRPRPVMAGLWAGGGRSITIVDLAASESVGDAAHRAPVPVPPAWERGPDLPPGRRSRPGAPQGRSTRTGASTAAAAPAVSVVRRWACTTPTFSGPRPEWLPATRR